MSRAALKRVKAWGESYRGLSGYEQLARDFEAVVVMAERAAELERRVRDAMELLDSPYTKTGGYGLRGRDYLDTLRAALSPKRQSRRGRAR